MNFTLWILQGILCVFFLMVGGMKVFAYEAMQKKRQVARPVQGNQPSKQLMMFIGACEITGAFGLVLPLLTGVAAFLTAWAALGLALIMLLASLYHLRQKESPAMTAVLLLLLSFIAYGRFGHQAARPIPRPIPPMGATQKR